MINIILNVICMLILFTCVLVLRKKLLDSLKEIAEKDKTIERLEREISRMHQDEIQRNIDNIQDDLIILDDLKSTLAKINRNYEIYQKDKIILGKFLINRFKRANISTKALDKINVHKKYTFKEATEFISDYISQNEEELSNEQSIKLLNVLHYLLNR